MAMGVKDLLEVKNFLKVADDTPKTHEHYDAVNARFFLVVSSSIHPSAMGATRIVMQFTDAQDGRGAFSALEATYKPNTTFSKLQLHANLADPHREDNEDITSYCLRLTNLRDELRIKEGSNQVWPDMQLLESLLRGLRGDAKFATTIEIINTTENITILRATQLLRQAEERGRTTSSTGKAALFAAPAAGAAEFKGTCFNCGKPGHRSRECRRRKNTKASTRGNQRDDKSSRGDPKTQAGAGTTGKYCQVHPMGKHDASECKVLKQHPHLATALAAVATHPVPDSGSEELPNIRPFSLDV
jgi:hypothetical protein